MFFWSCSPEERLRRNESLLPTFLCLFLPRREEYSPFPQGEEYFPAPRRIFFPQRRGHFLLPQRKKHSSCSTRESRELKKYSQRGWDGFAYPRTKGS